MFSDVFSNPLFGVLLTILIYTICLKIFSKLKLPLFNPMLLSIIFIIIVLKTFNKITM